ncbi:MAG: KEOPS complex kinase/ATPase Bud32 [Thermoplasmata archaeon]
MAPSEEKELIAKGAEAEIWKTSWRGRDAVVKKRVRKGYRHPELDSRIQKERIRSEARLMRGARKAGVPVPIIYDLREEEWTMILQYFHGERAIDAIEEGLDIDLEQIGRYVGKLHSHGITHGDLTTSNILYNEKEKSYCFIDFSLGKKASSVEDMGVDLHLMKEALVSVHEEPLKKFDKIIAGYKQEFDGSSAVIDKVKDIEERGRYR